jgi:hypothetical protein
LEWFDNNPRKIGKRMPPFTYNLEKQMNILEKIPGDDQRVSFSRIELLRVSQFI